MEVQYFANRRQILKLTTIVEEQKIAIEELERQVWDSELKALHLTLKQTQMKIDEFHLNKLIEKTAELKKQLQEKV